jgi:mono/diheme cytochrome c family protein
MNRSDSTLQQLRVLVAPAAPPHRGSSPLVAVGLALFVLFGCGGDSGDPATAEGQALYEANCMACHGEGALGDGGLASTLPVSPPALQEHLGHHTEAQLIRLIQAGVPPAMPPTALSEDEIGLIVDYLWTLVPESEVAALREMQQQMEMRGDSAAGAMPGMPMTHDMPGMHDMSTMDSTPAPPVESGQ